jgi:hypothetical protein
VLTGFLHPDLDLAVLLGDLVAHRGIPSSAGRDHHHHAGRGQGRGEGQGPALEVRADGWHHRTVQFTGTASGDWFAFYNPGGDIVGLAPTGANGGTLRWFTFPARSSELLSTACQLAAGVPRCPFSARFWQHMRIERSLRYGHDRVSPRNRARARYVFDQELQQRRWARGGVSRRRGGRASWRCGRRCRAFGCRDGAR